MIKMTLEELRQKYKRGWYRKGKTYRFLCAIDGMGFLIYKTKTAMKKKTSTVWGLIQNVMIGFLKLNILD